MKLWRHSPLFLFFLWGLLNPSSALALTVVTAPATVTVTPIPVSGKSVTDLFMPSGPFTNTKVSGFTYLPALDNRAAPSGETFIEETHAGGGLTLTPFDTNDGGCLIKFNAALQYYGPEADKYFLLYLMYRDDNYNYHYLIVASDGNKNAELLYYASGAPPSMRPTGTAIPIQLVDHGYPNASASMWTRPVIELTNNEIILKNRSSYSTEVAIEYARLPMTGLPDAAVWLSYGLSSLRTNDLFGHGPITVMPRFNIATSIPHSKDDPVPNTGLFDATYLRAPNPYNIATQSQLESALTWSSFGENGGDLAARFAAILPEAPEYDRYWVVYLKCETTDGKEKTIAVAGNSQTKNELLLYEPGTELPRLIERTGEIDDDPAPRVSYPQLDLRWNQIVVHNTTLNTIYPNLYEKARFPLSATVGNIRRWTSYSFSSLRIDNAFGYRNLEIHPYPAPKPADLAGSEYVRTIRPRTEPKHKEFGDTSVDFTQWLNFPSLSPANKIQMSFDTKLTPEPSAPYPSYLAIKYRSTLGLIKTVYIKHDGVNGARFYRVSDEVLGVSHPLYSSGTNTPNEELTNTGPYHCTVSLEPDKIRLISSTEEYATLDLIARFAGLGEAKEYLSYQFFSLFDETRSDLIMEVKNLSISAFPEIDPTHTIVGQSANPAEKTRWLDELSVNNQLKTTLTGSLEYIGAFTETPVEHPRIHIHFAGDQYTPMIFADGTKTMAYRNEYYQYLPRYTVEVDLVPNPLISSGSTVQQFAVRLLKHRPIDYMSESSTNPDDLITVVQALNITGDATHPLARILRGESVPFSLSYQQRDVTSQFELSIEGMSPIAMSDRGSGEHLNLNRIGLGVKETTLAHRARSAEMLSYGEVALTTEELNYRVIVGYPDHTKYRDGHSFTNNSTLTGTLAYIGSDADIPAPYIYLAHNDGSTYKKRYALIIMGKPADEHAFISLRKYSDDGTWKDVASHLLSAPPDGNHPVAKILRGDAQSFALRYTNDGTTAFVSLVLGDGEEVYFEAFDSESAYNDINHVGFGVWGNDSLEARDPALIDYNNLEVTHTFEIPDRADKMVLGFQPRGQLPLWRKHMELPTGNIFTVEGTARYTNSSHSDPTIGLQFGTIDGANNNYAFDLKLASLSIEIRKQTADGFPVIYSAPLPPPPGARHPLILMREGVAQPFKISLNHDIMSFECGEESNKIQWDDAVASDGTIMAAMTHFNATAWDDTSSGAQVPSMAEVIISDITDTPPASSWERVRNGSPSAWVAVPHDRFSIEAELSLTFDNEAIIEFDKGTYHYRLYLGGTDNNTYELKLYDSSSDEEYRVASGRLQFDRTDSSDRPILSDYTVAVSIIENQLTVSIDGEQKLRSGFPPATTLPTTDEPITQARWRHTTGSGTYFVKNVTVSEEPSRIDQFMAAANALIAQAYAAQNNATDRAWLDRMRDINQIETELSYNSVIFGLPSETINLLHAKMYEVVAAALSNIGDFHPNQFVLTGNITVDWFAPNRMNFIKLGLYHLQFEHIPTVNGFSTNELIINPSYGGLNIFGTDIENRFDRMDLTPPHPASAWHADQTATKEPTHTAFWIVYDDGIITFGFNTPVGTDPIWQYVGSNQPATFRGIYLPEPDRNYSPGFYIDPTSITLSSDLPKHRSYTNSIGDTTQIDPLVERKAHSRELSVLTQHPFIIHNEHPADSNPLTHDGVKISFDIEQAVGHQFELKALASDDTVYHLTVREDGSATFVDYDMDEVLTEAPVGTFTHTAGGTTTYWLALEGGRAVLGQEADTVFICSNKIHASPSVITHFALIGSDGAAKTFSGISQSDFSKSEMDNLVFEKGLYPDPENDGKYIVYDTRNGRGFAEPHYSSGSNWEYGWPLTPVKNGYSTTFTLDFFNKVTNIPTLYLFFTSERSSARGLRMHIAESNNGSPTKRWIIVHSSTKGYFFNESGSDENFPEKGDGTYTLLMNTTTNEILLTKEGFDGEFRIPLPDGHTASSYKYLTFGAISNPSRITPPPVPVNSAWEYHNYLYHADQLLTVIPTLSTHEQITLLTDDAFMQSSAHGLNYTDTISAVGSDATSIATLTTKNDEIRAALTNQLVILVPTDSFTLEGSFKFTDLTETSCTAQFFLTDEENTFSATPSYEFLLTIDRTSSSVTITLNKQGSAEALAQKTVPSAEFTGLGDIITDLQAGESIPLALSYHASTFSIDSQNHTLGSFMLSAGTPLTPLFSYIDTTPQSPLDHVRLSTLDTSTSYTDFAATAYEQSDSLDDVLTRFTTLAQRRTELQTTGHPHSVENMIEPGITSWVTALPTLTDIQTDMTARDLIDQVAEAGTRQQAINDIIEARRTHLRLLAIQGMASFMGDIAVFLAAVEEAAAYSTLPSTASLSRAQRNSIRKIDQAALTTLPPTDDPSLFLEDGTTLSPLGIASAAVRSAMETYDVTTTDATAIVEAAEDAANTAYTIREDWIRVLAALQTHLTIATNTQRSITEAATLDALAAIILPDPLPTEEVVASHPSLPDVSITALIPLVNNITTSMSGLGISLSNNIERDNLGNKVTADTIYAIREAMIGLNTAIHHRKTTLIVPNMTTLLATARERIADLAVAATPAEVDAVLPLDISAVETDLTTYSFETLPTPAPDALTTILEALYGEMGDLSISLTDKPTDSLLVDTVYIIRTARDLVEAARSLQSTDLTAQAINTMQLEVATVIATILQTYSLADLALVLVAAGESAIDLTDDLAVTNAIFTKFDIETFMAHHEFSDANTTELNRTLDSVRSALSGQRALLGQLDILTSSTLPPSDILTLIAGMIVPELEEGKVETTHETFVRTQLDATTYEEYITSFLASYKTIGASHPISSFPESSYASIIAAANTAQARHDGIISAAELAIQTAIDARYAELQRLRDEAYEFLQEVFASHKETIARFTFQAQLIAYTNNDDTGTGIVDFTRGVFDEVITNTRTAFTNNGEADDLINPIITELNDHIDYWMRLLLIIDHTNILLGDDVGSGNELLDRLELALTRGEIIALDRSAFDDKTQQVIGLITDEDATPTLRIEHTEHYTTLVSEEIKRVNTAIANALLAEYIEEVVALIAAAVPDDDFMQIAEMGETDIQTEETDLAALLAEPDGALTSLRQQLADLGVYPTDADDHPIDIQIEQPLRTAFQNRRMARADAAFSDLEQLRDELLLQVTDLLESSDLPLIRLAQLMSEATGPEQRRISELTPQAEVTEQLFSYVKEPERSSTYPDSRVDAVEELVETTIQNARNTLLAEEAARLLATLRAEADDFINLINEKQNTGTLTMLWSERFSPFDATVAATRVALQTAYESFGDLLTPEQEDILDSDQVNPIRQRVIDAYDARFELLQSQEIARGYVIQLNERVNEVIQALLDNPSYDDRLVKQALYNQLDDVHIQTEPIVSRADALLPELDRVLLPELKQQVIDDMARLRDALRRNIYDIPLPPPLAATGEQFPSIVFAPWDVSTKYITPHSGFYAHFYLKTEEGRGFGLGMRYEDTSDMATYYSIARGEDENTNTTVQRRTEGVVGAQPYVFGHGDTPNNMGILDDGFVYYHFEHVNNTLHLLRYHPDDEETPYHTIFFVTDPAFSRDLGEPITVAFRKIAEQGEYVEVRNFEIKFLDEETKPSTASIATLPSSPLELAIQKAANSESLPETSSQIPAPPLIDPGTLTLPADLFDATISSDLTTGYSAEHPHGMQWVNDRLITPNDGMLTGSLTINATDYTPTEPTLIVTLASNEVSPITEAYATRYRLQLALAGKHLKLFKEFVDDGGVLTAEQIYDLDIPFDETAEHPINDLLAGAAVHFTVECLPHDDGTRFRLSLQSEGGLTFRWETPADASFLDVSRFGLNLWDLPSTREETMASFTALSVPGGMQQRVSAIVNEIEERISHAQSADNVHPHTDDNSTGMPSAISTHDLEYLESILMGQDNRDDLVLAAYARKQVLDAAITEQTETIKTSAHNAFLALQAENQRLLELITSATAVADLPLATALISFSDDATTKVSHANLQDHTNYNVTTEISTFNLAHTAKITQLKQDAENSFSAFINEKDHRIKQARTALVLADLPAAFSDAELTAVRTAFTSAGIDDLVRVGPEDSELVAAQAAVAAAIALAQESMKKVIALEGNTISIPTGGSTEKIAMATTRYQLPTGQKKQAKKVVTAVNGTHGISYHFADIIGNTYSFRIDRDGIFAKTNQEAFPAQPFNTSINFEKHPQTENVRDAMYQVVMCPVEEQITGTERRLHITFAIEQHLVINGKTKIRKARRSFMVTPEQGAPTTHYLPQHYQLAAPSSTEGSDERLTAEPLNKLPEVAEKKAALSVTTGNVVQAVKQARRYDAGLPLQRSVGIRM